MAATTVYTDDVTPGVTENVHEVTVTIRDAGDRITGRFTVDLGDDNAKAIEKVLNKYRNAGKVVPLAVPGAANPNGENAKIRAWGVANGLKVSERGALPNDLKAAYAKEFPEGELTTNDHPPTEY